MMKVNTDASLQDIQANVTGWLVLAALLYSPTPVHADIPLSVESLLGKKGDTRTELTLSYANSNRLGIEASDPVAVQTGTASFVDIPSQVGERYSNTDVLVATAGVRHGLDEDTEIYANTSAVGIDSRTESVAGLYGQNTDSYFNDAWVGVNQRFRNDADKAALLGFAGLQVIERQADGSYVNGKSALLGMTTYQTHDPVVLSMTGSVRLNACRTEDGGDYCPGSNLSISPSVGFAANDKVTLTTGLTWRMQQADTFDGKAEGIRRTKTSLDLGLGYALGKRDILDIGARPQVSGDGDVQVTMSWLHRLEK